VTLSPDTTVWCAFAIWWYLWVQVPTLSAQPQLRSGYSVLWIELSPAI